MRDFHVHGIRFVAASAALRRNGLLGFVSCKFGDALALDGLTIRLTGKGELTLSFPERRDQRGRRHAIVRPLDQAARRAITAHVLDALRQQGVTP